MPQIPVGSSNIIEFGFSATLDIYAKTLKFDTSSITTYESGGINRVLGICFKVEGFGDVIMHDINFSSPDIIPATSQIYTLDLSAFGLPFIVGNTLKITGQIKDQDGTIYSTDPAIKTICKPPKLNESGYVPGLFQVTPNCVDNVLTVKELTPLTYDKKEPLSKTKTGVLNYPTGSRAPVSFTGTPFSSNIIYTGEYIINCTTVAVYDLEDDIYVSVSYITKQKFPVTCQDFLGDIYCCLSQLQKTYQENCDNAVGAKAKQQTFDVLLPLINGIVGQFSGKDVSSQVAFIKKQLGCDCGTSSLGKNEMTPVNAAVTSIVLEGVGGTSIDDPTINGDTKTFQIASNAYQVAKGDTGDVAWSIVADTSTPYLIKYKLTFNYAVMAGYILTAIAANPTLITQLNNLINSTGANITGLNGRCIIDLTTRDYVISQGGLSGSTAIVNVVIDGTTFTAPGALFATNVVGIAAWLNSLTKGTFSAIYSAGILTILSVANSHTLSTITLSSPSLTLAFQSSSATLVQILQAMIDYICALNSSQIALAGNLSLQYLDYNGNVQQYNYTTLNDQHDFNTGVANVISLLTNRMYSLTSVNCAAIKAACIDRASSVFAGGSARLYGQDQDANCIGFTVEQIALGVMQAVNQFASVKTAFCAIDCATPAICPDVSGISLGIVSGNIGFYGLTWATTPSAVQTVTLQYKLTSSSIWITQNTSIGIFANGNINGASPVQILGLTPGSSYNVKVFNNCGGNGAISTITVPTSSIFSGQFLLENALYLICGATPVTLYSGSSFGTGTVMYTDIGLTTPVTGFIYISPTTGGNIYTLNSSTGVVGTDTLSTCASGTAGTYTLGNNSGTICAVATQTLYTNGAFIVGGILYTDSALTTPVTGYDFVVNAGDSVIYHLNNATGVIGATTGSSCTSVNTFLRLGNTPTTLCAVTPASVYTDGTYGSGKVLYTDAARTTPVTGFAYVSDGSTIFNVNTVTGLVGSALPQSCGDVLIYNSTAWGTVTGVAGITGFALTGTITPGNSQAGTHTAFSSSVQITVTGAGSGTAILRKNGSLISTKPLSAGTVTFDFNSFVIGDILIIQLG